MNETTRKRLRDARDACQQIGFEILGLDEQIYVQATTPTYAVNWLLVVLGEALNVALREYDALEEAIPDARAAIDRIIAFYAEHEPSSPLPILLHRARRLIGADFLTIMRDIAPDGVENIRSLGGIRDDDDD